MRYIKPLFLVFFIFANVCTASADVSFSVNPMKLQISALPGKHSSAQIEVRNLSKNKPLNIFIKKADLKIKENGDINFKAPQKGKNFAANWLSFDKQKLSIKPLGSQIVKVNLKVPPSAGYGEHYAAVLFETKSAAIRSQAGVLVGSRIAALVLQNSPGHQLLRGKINNFNFPKFVLLWPVDDASFPLKASFKNIGNTHFDLMSEFFIKNSVGKVVFARNFGNQTVVPGFSKNYSVKVVKELPAGVYKVFMRATYAGGKTSQINKTFYVIDIRTIGVLVLILLIIGFIGIVLLVQNLLKRKAL